MTSTPTKKPDDRFRKSPCTRCGEDTYRVSFVWKDGRSYLVCGDCLKRHAAPYLRDSA